MVKRILLLLTMLSMAGCARISEQDVGQALNEAFYPEADRETAERILSKIVDGPPDISLLQSELGTNNLSVFLLILKSDTPLTESDLYCFSWDAPMIDLMAKHFSSTGSFVTIDDAKELLYRWVSPRTVEGSLKLDMDYNVKTELVFRVQRRGGKLMVTRLAVKRKDSESVEDGYTIFSR